MASHKGDWQSGPLPFLQHSKQVQELVSFHFSSLVESLLFCDLCLQHFQFLSVSAREPEGSRSIETLFPISQMKEMKQRQDLKNISKYTCQKPKAEHRARLTTLPQHQSLDCNKCDRISEFH